MMCSLLVSCLVVLLFFARTSKSFLVSPLLHHPRFSVRLVASMGDDSMGDIDSLKWFDKANKLGLEGEKVQEYVAVSLTNYCDEVSLL